MGKGFSILIILVAIGFLVFGFYRRNHELELLKTGKHATAEVIECTEVWIDDSSDDYSSGHYEDERTIRYDGHTVKMAGTTNYCEVGNHLEVIYNREKPTDYIVASSPKGRSTGAFIFSGCLSIMAIIIWKVSS